MTARRSGERATSTTTTSRSSSPSRTTSPTPTGTTTTATGGQAGTAPTTTHSTGAATTDRPRRFALSVRSRIIVTVGLLLAVALGGAGAIVYAIGSTNEERSVRAEIEQELDEFDAFINPDQEGTRDALPPTLRGKLVAFLSANVPEETEVLVGWLNGRARLVSAGALVADAEETLLPDPAFREAARRVTQGGGTTTTLDSEAHGELVVAAQTVAQGADDGALVVVSYLELEKAEIRETMRTYALVAFVSLVVITLLAAWQSGRLLAPLRVLRQTTEQIGATDLAKRLPEVGNDDITALTRTFNGMLARLEAAFVGQREFLDDAGHELKTPLTVLRGHLELLDHEDEEEVAETRALLLDEIDRMSRLVGDLILLAKHDRPDFLTPSGVSVERLTHTLLAKARALADRSWTLDAVGEGVARVDEQRVTQAVLQLADNAVKHTEPGGEIAIGSAVAEGWLSLWVRDTGPGVAEDQREHIFERFGRGTTRPDDEGFGLGLSIVRAIMEAHGGTVEVSGATDPPGAVFTLRLPVEQPWPAS
jgi:signal transduction histidine kinase